MKFSVLLVKLRYMKNIRKPYPILWRSLMPVSAGAMKNRGIRRTTITLQATFAIPSLILGLALTMSLPRKSKRLPVREKSTGNSSPVAEEC